MPLSWTVCFFIGLLVPFCISQRVDMTRDPGTSGTGVVGASLSLIQDSGVFSTDNRLLRRVAYVETRDGFDPETYRAGYNGGIWQVDEAVFTMTQDVATNPELTQIYADIFRTLQVNWTAATWEDLRRPLYSALAARIYFEIVNEPIPIVGDLQGQGTFWVTHYFIERVIEPNGENALVENFISEVNTLEAEECPARGIDLCFIFDSSGSVGVKNFELEKQFAINVTRTFTIGPTETQVAAIAYSGFANISFFFNTFNNQSSIARALDDIMFFDIPGNGRPSTNTADALIRARNEIFTTSRGARDRDLGYPRVTIVVTDGQSNVNRSLTLPSAQALREDSVTVFAVGVGRNINSNELNGIASSQNFVIRLSQFNLVEFVGLQRVISAEACTVPAPIDIGIPITNNLENGQVTFFQFQLPSPGMTVRLQRQSGSVTLYGSFQVRNPNAAFHDFKIENSGDRFVSPEDVGASVPAESDRIAKRAIDATGFTNTTLYVSIEGQEDMSVFTLETTFGDTSSVGQHLPSLSLLAAMLCILCTLFM